MTEVTIMVPVKVPHGPGCEGCKWKWHGQGTPTECRLFPGVYLSRNRHGRLMKDPRCSNAMSYAREAAR